TNDAEVSTDSDALFDDGATTATFTITPSAFQTSTANITLQATNDITVDAAITLTQAGITLALQAGHDIIINANITGASSNRFIFEADSVHTTDGLGSTVGANSDGTLSIAGVTVDSAGGDIHLLGELFTIDPLASIAAGAGDVYLSESDGGGFGAAWTSDDLARISSTGTLTLGQAITAGTDNTGAGSQTITVSNVSVGARTFASTVAGTIRFVANDGVSFTDALTTNQSLVIDADADDDGVGSFSSAALGDVTTNNFDVTIVAADLSMSGDLDAGTGHVSITTSDGSDIGIGDPSASGMQISRNEFARISANRLEVETTGVIAVDDIREADSDEIGTVLLRATGAGSTVTFTSEASSFNALEVEATDGVTVGIGLTTDIGGISINADTDGNDSVGALTVSSGVTIDSGDASILLIADSIDLSGSVDSGTGDVTIQDSDGNGIDFGASTGGLDLSDAEYQRISAANLTLETDDDIAVVGITSPSSIAGTVNLIADGAASQVTFNTTGSSFGSLTVSANEGITVGIDLATTGGTLSLDANRDTSVDNTGTLTVSAGVAVTTNNGAVTVSASDVALAGTLNAGTASITISEDGTGVVVGDGGGTGFILSGAELALMSATGLTLNTTRGVQIEEVQASDSNGIAGVFAINADQGVTLSAGRTATFHSLSIAANTGITLNGDLSTDTGNLALDADANDSNDGSDDLTFSSGVVIESAGTLTLESTSGTLSATDTLTLYAADGITIANNFSVGASGGFGLTIDADRDAGDGVGTLTVASGVTINAAATSTSVTANDLDLQGALNTTAVTVQSTGGLGLGDTAVSGGMHVSKTELQQVGAASLVLNVDGNLVVDNVATSDFGGALTMAATSTATFSGTASSFTELSVSANEGVAFDVSVASTTAGITVNADSDANDDTGTLSVASGATLSSGGNNISLTANDVSFAGVVNAGAGSIFITDSDGSGIGLGAATVAGGLNLVNADLDGATLIASGLTFSTSGGSQIDNVAATSLATTTLNATDSISFVNNASSFGNISFNSDDRISVGVDVSGGVLTLDGDANATADTNDDIVFSDGVQVTADDLTLRAANGQMMGLGALTLNANDQIQIEHSLSVTGVLSINADANADGTGTLSVAAVADVSTSNSQLSLVTSDLTLSGTLSSGTAALQIQDSDGSGIDLGSSTFSGGLVIDSAALASMTAGDLLITTAGNLGVGAVNQPANITGQVQLDATGLSSQIQFDSGTSSFFSLAANAVSGIAVQQAITTTTGGMALNADSDADGTGNLDVAATGSLVTSNQAVQATAADVDLQGVIDAGNAGVTIASSTGADIGLGSVTETLNITGGELALITSGNVTLQTTGTIRADGLVATDSANADLITLRAEQQIDFQTSGNVLGALVANAENGVLVRGDLQTVVGDLSVDGDSNNSTDTTDGITFLDGVTVQSAGVLTLDATAGMMTASGSLSLLAADGIVISDSLTGTAGVGTLTINADTDAGDQTGTLTIAVGATINTNDRMASITAEDLALDGAIDSGAAVLEIVDSDGDGIGLGASAPSDGVAISGAELQRISATDVRLESSGNIDVDQVTAANSDNLAGTTFLVSAAEVTFSLNGATFNALSVAAAQGIDIDGDLTTDTGNLVLDGDSNSTDDGGDDAIVFASGVQVQSATTLTLAAATGAMTADDLVLRAAEGIKLEHALSATGSLAINADTTTSSAGAFELASGAVLSTSNQSISITADDLILGANLDSGTASIAVIESDGDGVGLGDATVATGLNLTGAELLTFTAGDLTLESGGAIVVENGVQSAGVTGATILRSGGTVAFLNQASTFGGLQVEADDGIDIDVSLTTTSGNLTLDGDSNGAADTLDNIDIAASTLNSAGSLVLSATTSGIDSDSHLTLNANDGVTLSSRLTAGGTLTINADSDSGDGVGTFEIASGVAVTSTGMSIEVTANEIDWQGSIGDATTALAITDSDGDGIGLGVAPGAGGIEITGSELQSLTATTFTLTTNGEVIVGGITAANSNNISGTLTINAAEITFDSGTSTFNTLVAQANQGILVNGNLITDTGELTLDGDTNASVDVGADSIDFTSGVQVRAATVLTLRAETGSLTAADATFQAAEGIHLQHSLAATGAISFEADTTTGSAGVLTLATGANLTTSDFAISISADDLSLGGNIDSGTAATTITESDGDGIGLGDATVATGLNLSAAELLLFTAGDLELVSAGSIVVDNGVQSASVTGTTFLRSDATVSFVTQASTFAALNVQADDGVDIDVDVSTSQGDLSIDGDADGATDTRDDIDIAGGISLTSSGSIHLSASTSGITSDADLALVANDGVSIGDDLSAGGVLNVNADNDAGDGLGTFSIATGAVVTSAGMSINVTANQVDWLGSIGDAATALSLTDSDGDGIGLGVSPGAGGIEISGTELQGLTATYLTLTTTGDITVEGISAANSNNVSGVVELIGNQIAFGATGSTFNALTARASQGLTVNGNLTSDVGDLALDGDSNAANDVGPDSVVFADGVQIQSAGSLTLAAESREMSGDALTLRAADAIVISDSLALTGALTADADTDAGDDDGRFEITTGESVSADSIDLTANDFVFSGTVVSTGALAIHDSDGSGIGLGQTAIVNAIHLTDSELQQLTATDLTFETGGNFVLDDVSQPASITGTVSLQATGGSSMIAFSNNASSFGTLALTTTDGVVVDADLTTSGGLTVVADSDAGDQIGTLQIGAGASINSIGQTVSLTANDAELSGALNVGSGSITFIDSDGSGIGLGDAIVADG
ncbi:MAG: hypothetical protein AAFX06_28410, partial [Planctomycetota bacterium]